MLRLLFSLSLFLLALPRPTPACSLCGPGMREQTPLRQEMDKARLVLYGQVANARLTVNGTAGGGVTDFHVAKVLKFDPYIDGKKVIQLDRYIPILDLRDPPRFVLFCDIFKGTLDPYIGKQVQSAAVLDYLAGAKTYQGKGRAEALQYYFRFLDHADDTVALDAFLEFAHSSDAHVGQAAKGLDAAKVRALVQNPKTEPGKLGLFAFLLGACGTKADADLLRGLIAKGDDRAREALGGLLAGYIHLQPRPGWDLTGRILNDAKQDFKTRYAAVGAVRFWYGYSPAETKVEVLRCYNAMIEDSEMADIPIEDLRKWKLWDLTDRILAQYGKPSHDAPIRLRTIVRYALCCPLPQANQFLRRVERDDADMIRELRDGLELERNP